MSKKRKSTEANEDEPKIEVSDLLVLQLDAKAARPTPCTELQDLPNELIVEILAKAVVLEVMGMKLAKCVWKEKAHLVINRLRPVSSCWNDVLTTTFFRHKVHTILESTAESTFRLEILYQSPVSQISVAAVGDEVFLLHADNRGYGDCYINVHDRNSLSDVKDVIPLPAGLMPWKIVGCNVSKCVYMYVLTIRGESDPTNQSILRITKDEGQRYNVSPWISNPNWLNVPSVSWVPLQMYGSLKGDVIVHSATYEPNSSFEINIYDSSGALQHIITPPAGCPGPNYLYGVVKKSDGNLILMHSGPGLGNRGLKEIDQDGRVLRTHAPYSVGRKIRDVRVADCHDRVWTGKRLKDAMLFDSELNRLTVKIPNHEDDMVHVLCIGYNSDMERDTASLCN